MPFRDAVVDLQAGATAGGGGVLSAEDGVAAPGGLLAILGRRCRGEPRIDEFSGVLTDRVHAAGCKVFALDGSEMELGSEGYPADPLQPEV